MEEEKRNVHICELRHQLISRVLYHGFEQLQNNIEQSGSCWGKKANISLIVLSQYAISMQLLSESFNPEEDSRRVEDFCKTDFCIFTKTSKTNPDSDSVQIRNKMRDEAQRLSIPVLDSLKGTDLYGGELYQRLSSVTQNLLRLV